MSYGSVLPCETEYLAIQLATLKGITLVAAGGNEGDQGNPYEFPASLPHVLTVGALDDAGNPAFFSNSNAAIDLVAPGTDILTAVPVALDGDDGTRDGYEVVDGTSFSAPIVSAAAAWVRQVRPQLRVDQVSQVIRASARDIGTAGYDTTSGFGALDLAHALVQKPPPPDPKEPNDDILFVDGRAFGKPDRAIWRGGSRATLTAQLDAYEDPADVYRVRVPAHRTVLLAIRPSFGNPDLDLYDARASYAGQKGHRLARSARSGHRRRDAVAYRNRTGHTQTVYARVYIRSSETTLDAAYTLSAKRR
jgi:hypothetical protein